MQFTQHGESIVPVVAIGSPGRNRCSFTWGRSRSKCDIVQSATRAIGYDGAAGFAGVGKTPLFVDSLPWCDGG